MDQPPAFDAVDEGQRGEGDAVSRVFGPDLWLRFDMWSARAWEASQKAVEVAGERPAPISQDDVVFDPRIAALFHSAETAKEFAEMVNPLIALGMIEPSHEPQTGVSEEVVIDMIVGNEDFE